jgi:2-phosphosulfolactate phosphatase
MLLNSLAVHLLPALTSPAELAASTVVVLDILRASTTIATALVNGARSVVPCKEVADATAAAARLPAGTMILGGERGGLPIAGFDCGNSPAEYTRGRVFSRTVVFTTTNGTLAMQQCKLAAEVFIGGFVNLTAVCRRLAHLQGKRPIHLLCAGTRGKITREDVLCAGAIVERLLDDYLDEAVLNDQARLALDSWRAAMRCGQKTPPGKLLALSPAELRAVNALDCARLVTELRETQGGRNLIGLGMDSDIPLAAAIDNFDHVPELNVAEWRIV